jgi:hypothetical protein
MTRLFAQSSNLWTCGYRSGLVYQMSSMVTVRLVVVLLTKLVENDGDSQSIHGRVLMNRAMPTNLPAMGRHSGRWKRKRKPTKVKPRNEKIPVEATTRWIGVIMGRKPATRWSLEPFSLWLGRMCIGQLAKTNLVSASSVSSKTVREDAGWGRKRNVPTRV